MKRSVEKVVGPTAASEDEGDKCESQRGDEGEMGRRVDRYDRKTSEMRRGKEAVARGQMGKDLRG
jgi:hypothetical protein